MSEALSLPPCRTCAAETPKGVTLPPADYIGDMTTVNNSVYPWPLCETHMPFALVAGWKVYEPGDPEAAPLHAALSKQGE